MMGVAWAFSYRLTAALLEKFHQDTKKLHWYFIGLFISSFLGAKLFYLIVSSGDMFDAYTESLSFWLGGGFVFYGGLISGLIWTYLSRRFFKFIKPEMEKFLIPGLAFGHAIGRIGCFLAGCCYGHELESGSHFPIQLVESAALFILGVYVIKNIHKQKVVAIYLLSYSILRFGLEYFRADEIRGVLPYGLSTSQYISIGVFIFALFLIKRLIKIRKASSNI